MSRKSLPFKTFVIMINHSSNTYVAEYCFGDVEFGILYMKYYYKSYTDATIEVYIKEFDNSLTFQYKRNLYEIL